jgi:hypothetical protein
MVSILSQEVEKGGGEVMADAFSRESDMTWDLDPYADERTGDWKDSCLYPVAEIVRMIKDKVITDYDGVMRIKVHTHEFDVASIDDDVIHETLPIGCGMGLLDWLEGWAEAPINEQKRIKVWWFNK